MIILLVLIYSAYINACHDLKPIETYKTSPAILNYSVDHNAVKGIKQFLKVENNKGIELKQINEHDLIMKKDQEYYKIRREEGGSNLELITMNQDDTEKADELKEIDTFEIEGFGVGFLYAVYYQDKNENNLNIEKGDARVVLLKESSTVSDNRLDGHNFGISFLRIKFNKPDVECDIIDIKDLSKRLKEKFPKKAYIIAQKLGYRIDDLQDAGFEMNDETLEKDKNWNDNIKPQLREIFREVKSNSDIPKSVLMQASALIALVCKIDKGIYLIGEAGDNNAFVMGYELSQNYQPLYPNQIKKILKTKIKHDK